MKQAGGGGCVNGRVTVAGRAIEFGQFAYGVGLGRYIGGLVPDVSVSADGRIHPIRTYSWVSGVEGRLSTHVDRVVRRRRERRRQLLDRHRRDLYRVRLSLP